MDAHISQCKSFFVYIPVSKTGLILTNVFFHVVAVYRFWERRDLVLCYLCGHANSSDAEQDSGVAILQSVEG